MTYGIPRLTKTVKMRRALDHDTRVERRTPQTVYNNNVYVNQGNAYKGGWTGFRDTFLETFATTAAYGLVNKYIGNCGMAGMMNCQTGCYSGGYASSKPSIFMY